MEIIKRFLEGSVVIPYSNELLSLLNEACHSYISEEEEDKYEDIEQMAECFLWGIGSEKFQSVLNDLANKENPIKALPKVVIQRLAAYECYIMIMEEEDERISSIMATIFMNYILSVKTRLKSIPCGDLIHAIYNKHLSKYISNNDKVCEIGDSELIKGIAEAEDAVKYITETAEKETDEMPVKYILKKLAKAAAYYEYDRALRDSYAEEIQDPFVIVFIAVSNLMKHTLYSYYDYPFFTKIMGLLDKTEISKRKTISKIIESLGLHAQKYVDEPLSGSSLILRLLHGEDIPSKDALNATQISVKEFCVYLYYELLIENILNQIYDNGK